MKCCIVTVYNSMNCGSFLQAYALGRFIGNMGHEVLYYRIETREASRIRKTAIKSLLKLDISSFTRTLGQTERFERVLKKLDVTEKNDLPVYILGSDTVWDISTPSLEKRHDIFWGERFTGRIISYAPSIGYSVAENFQNAEWVRNALGRMEAVSVRENRAKEILENYTDKEISVVCDPTLLIDAKDYNSLTDKKGEDCIFLYYYGRVPEEYRNELVKLSKSENVPIITFGNANSGFCKAEPYDPARFIELFQSARYVVTDTFHGTVFSHIFQKSFAVINNDKPKITDFIEKMGTSDRKAVSASDMITVLKTPLDTEKVKSRLSAERESGVRFLTEHIGSKQ